MTLLPPPPDLGHVFPPPEQVEEMQAFAFIAGYEFKSEGQGWTDGTGRIRGCSWKLSRIPARGRQYYLVGTWSEYCPNMATMKAAIRDDLDRIERMATTKAAIRDDLDRIERTRKHGK